MKEKIDKELEKFLKADDVDNDSFFTQYFSCALVFLGNLETYKKILKLIDEEGKIIFQKLSSSDRRLWIVEKSPEEL